jgi:hypothetical protein
VKIDNHGFPDGVRNLLGFDGSESIADVYGCNGHGALGSFQAQLLIWWAVSRTGQQRMVPLSPWTIFFVPDTILLRWESVRDRHYCVDIGINTEHGVLASSSNVGVHILEAERSIIDGGASICREICTSHVGLHGAIDLGGEIHSSHSYL